MKDKLYLSEIWQI